MREMTASPTSPRHSNKEGGGRGREEERRGGAVKVWTVGEVMMNMEEERVEKMNKMIDSICEKGAFDLVGYGGEKGLLFYIRPSAFSRLTSAEVAVLPSYVLQLLSKTLQDRPIEGQGLMLVDQSSTNITSLAEKCLAETIALLSSVALSEVGVKYNKTYLLVQSQVNISKVRWIRDLLPRSSLSPFVFQPSPVYASGGRGGGGRGAYRGESGEYGGGGSSGGSLYDDERKNSAWERRKVAFLPSADDARQLCSVFSAPISLHMSRFFSAYEREKRVSIASHTSDQCSALAWEETIEF
uniref:Uncharacterized protein n=1 Tax=Palpitomonas bilix TaxID=652834 RepID=A0A7S3DL89_9EUKA